MTSAQLRQLGYTEFRSPRGRPIPSGSVLVPENIYLVGDSLRWGTQEGRRVEFSPEAFDTFLQLWSAKAEKILEFAQKWGVLVMQRSASDASPNVMRPCGDNLEAGEEPLDAWRYFSRRASAVLGIADSLRNDRVGDAEDWSVIADPHFDPQVDEPPDFNPTVLWQPYGMTKGPAIPTNFPHDDAIAAARELLLDELWSWMTFWRSDRSVGVSDLRLTWEPERCRWRVMIDFNDYLFAAIALQLVLVVAEADNLYTCSGCGRPYVRTTKRRPKAGWANYCANCFVDGSAERKAAKKYRKRRSEAQRLKAAGMSVAAIATTLSVPAARVENWIKQEDHVQTKTRKQ